VKYSAGARAGLFCGDKAMEYQIVSPGSAAGLAFALERNGLERGSSLSLPPAPSLVYLRSGLLGPAQGGIPGHDVWRQGQVLARPLSALVSFVARQGSEIDSLSFPGQPRPQFLARFGAGAGAGASLAADGTLDEGETLWSGPPRLLTLSESGRGILEGALAILGSLAASSAEEARRPPRPTLDLIAAAALTQILGLFASAAAQDQAPASGEAWTVADVVAWIDEHYEESFSLDEMVRRCAMNTSDFSRRFKEFAGFPLFEYLNRRRVSRAALLLKNGELPIIEVAYSVGYNNLSFFNRYFLRLMGRSPGEYRRLHR